MGTVEQHGLVKQAGMLPHHRAGHRHPPVNSGGAWAFLQRGLGALAHNSIPGNGPRALPQHRARHSVASAAEAQLQDRQATMRQLGGISKQYKQWAVQTGRVCGHTEAGRDHNLLLANPAALAPLFTPSCLPACYACCGI